MRDKAQRPGYVIGPRGTILTRDDLPSARTVRWVRRRKAEIFIAVHGGLLSLDDACVRYGISVDEFLCWRQIMEGTRSSRSSAIAPRAARPAERSAIEEEVELLLHQAKSAPKI